MDSPDNLIDDDEDAPMEIDENFEDESREISLNESVDLGDSDEEDSDEGGKTKANDNGSKKDKQIESLDEENDTTDVTETEHSQDEAEKESEITQNDESLDDDNDSQLEQTTEQEESLEDENRDDSTVSSDNPEATPSSSRTGSQDSKTHRKPILSTKKADTKTSSQKSHKSTSDSTKSLTASGRITYSFDFPSGWRVEARQRMSGVCASKFDVMWRSPDNLNYHKRDVLATYLARNKTGYKIEDFDFAPTVLTKKGILNIPAFANLASPVRHSTPLSSSTKNRKQDLKSKNKKKPLKVLSGGVKKAKNSLKAAKSKSVLKNKKLALKQIKASSKGKNKTKGKSDVTPLPKLLIKMKFGAGESRISNASSHFLPASKPIDPNLDIYDFETSHQLDEESLSGNENISINKSQDKSKSKNKKSPLKSKSGDEKKKPKNESSVLSDSNKKKKKETRGRKKKITETKDNLSVIEPPKKSQEIQKKPKHKSAISGTDLSQTSAADDVDSDDSRALVIELPTEKKKETRGRKKKTLTSEEEKDKINKNSSIPKDEKVKKKETRGRKKKIRTDTEADLSQTSMAETCESADDASFLSDDMSINEISAIGTPSNTKTFLSKSMEFQETDVSMVSPNSRRPSVKESEIAKSEKILDQNGKKKGRGRPRKYPLSSQVKDTKSNIVLSPRTDNVASTRVEEVSYEDYQKMLTGESPAKKARVEDKPSRHQSYLHDLPKKLTADFILNNNISKVEYVKRSKIARVDKPNLRQDEKWIPPHSPFCLVQENLYQDPWKLLVATIFLSKPATYRTIPTLWKFFNRYPTVEEARQADETEVAEILFPLGFNYERAKTVIRFSDEFSGKKWKYPIELHGVSDYGNDSYRIFCLPEWKDVEPSDPKLLDYQQWLFANHKRLDV